MGYIAKTITPKGTKKIFVRGTYGVYCQNGNSKKN